MSTPSSLPAPGGRLLLAGSGPGSSLINLFEISVLDLGTGAAQALGVASDATWFRDGTRVHLVVNDKDCQPTLVTKTVDGGTTGKVGSGLHALDYGFAWSPDDRFVSFVRYHNGPPTGMCGSQGGAWPADQVVGDVVVMEVDGSNPRVVVKEASSVSPPVWSPDGRHIALYATRGDGATLTSRLLVIEAATGKTVEYPSTGGGILTWSPDGTRLAFEAIGSGDGTHAVVLDLAGAVPRDLGRIGQEVYGGLAWSPDGTRLAAKSWSSDGVSNVRAGGTILVVNAGSGSVADLKITDADGPGRVTWSPDGAWLAYVPEIVDRINGGAHPGPVSAVAVDGSSPRVLVGVDADHHFDGVAWAPDPAPISY